MEFTRETVEEHVATIRGLRDTIRGGAENPPNEDFDRLAGCVESLAAITEELVRAMGPSKHAAAVSQEMNHIGFGHSEPEHMGSPTGGYPATKRVDHGAVCTKLVRNTDGDEIGLPCVLVAGHGGDCAPSDPRD